MMKLPGRTLRRCFASVVLPEQDAPLCMWEGIAYQWMQSRSQFYSVTDPTPTRTIRFFRSGLTVAESRCSILMLMLMLLVIYRQAVEIGVLQRVRFRWVVTMFGPGLNHKQELCKLRLRALTHVYILIAHSLNSLLISRLTSGLGLSYGPNIQTFPRSDLAPLPPCHLACAASLHHWHCIYVENTIQCTLFTRSGHSPRCPPVRRPHLHS